MVRIPPQDLETTHTMRTSKAEFEPITASQCRFSSHVGSIDSKKFVFHPLVGGGEDETRIRTRMTQFLIFGIVASDWSERVAVVHPFKLNAHVLRRNAKALKLKVLEGKHLLETALDWQAKKTGGAKFRL